MACPARPVAWSCCRCRWTWRRRPTRRSSEEIDRSTPRDLISRSHSRPPSPSHASPPRPSAGALDNHRPVRRPPWSREPPRRRLFDLDPSAVPSRPATDHPSPPPAARRSKNGRILLTRRTGWRDARSPALRTKDRTQLTAAGTTAATANLARI